MGFHSCNQVCYGHVGIEYTVYISLEYKKYDKNQGGGKHVI